MFISEVSNKEVSIISKIGTVEVEDLDDKIKVSYDNKMIFIDKSGIRVVEEEVWIYMKF